MSDGPAISVDFRPLRVGDGHGFVVEGPQARYVITAAHCLPKLPPVASWSDPGERTYRALLGPRGGQCGVWAECLLVDPVSDIAILGSPDGQELYDEALAYDALTEAAVPLAISDPPPQWDEAKQFVSGNVTFERAPVPVFTECTAWLFSLADLWFPCTVQHNGGRLSISDAAEEIKGGMSGIPIVVADGSAIGVMSISVGAAEDGHRQGEGGRLAGDLPGWLLRTLEPLARRRQFGIVR